MLSKLNGNKTYLGMIAAGILGMLQSFDVVQADQIEYIWVAIATWTGISVRHAMGKPGSK